MTGHGDALVQDDDYSVTVEIRAVNHRHYKLSLRGSESVLAMESRIDDQLRSRIRRGSVHANVQVASKQHPAGRAIDIEVLEGYRRQLRDHFGAKDAANVGLSTLLMLPGVVPDGTTVSLPADRIWPLVETGIARALDRLVAMREQEGEVMRRDLRENCEAVVELLVQIRRRTPEVVAAYRSRLLDRVRLVLSEHDVPLDPSDVVREVAVYADRSDISEEIVRLQGHIDHFLGCLSDNESIGRKLDFVTQEMFREANTIGSKANDGEIARAIVEIKNRVERMREMVQNVE
jgi:uncharacterized protein (TIGR00255 family)